jgi:hypothetical protein
VLHNNRVVALSSQPSVMRHAIRALLTIQTLEGPAGGSLYVRDFAMELFRQGHHPTVYCRRLGAVSAELLNCGIPVIDDVSKLTRPDIIHGNSPIETVAAMLRFADTPAIFIAHGWRSPDAIPPQLPNIIRYLAVSEHARDALQCFAGIPEDRIIIHQNATDLQRFRKRPPLPATPRRALVLSNSVSDLNCLGVVENACRTMQLSVDVIGLSMGTARMDTESVLGEYDIVFAKGRSALDALASGCAVMLCDASGFGELITTDNYELLRLRNFGLRALCLPISEDTMLAQLRRYNPEDAAAVTDLVRRKEGLFDATLALSEIYSAVIDEFLTTGPSDDRTIIQAVALFLDSIAPSANTFFVAEQYAPVERALRTAQGKLRQLTSTLGMTQLDCTELSRLSIAVVSCPTEFEPNQRDEVLVLLTNGSQRMISSLGEYPVHFAYHWHDQNGAVILFEGHRSELFPPLLPGQSYSYKAQVVAPHTSGEYVLRLTLVQERVTWLDELDVFADVRCTVLENEITTESTF